LLITLAYSSQNLSHAPAEAIRHTFLEYAELFFFLLVAMTYISTLLEGGVFDALRDSLVSKNFTYRSLFWIAGFLALLAPLATSQH
jgi:Na+/H+ antiporter NhaD/arsenite permease-like protein